MKIKNLILFILLICLILALIPFTNPNKNQNQKTQIIIKNTPNGKSNILILTIDDVILPSKRSNKILNNIVTLLETNQIPATLFCTPDLMQRYNFSNNFEIAQHGYSHRNPIDKSMIEFKGLKPEQVIKRLEKGKKELEHMGYKIHGQRSPAFHIEKSIIPKIKHLYKYDSSFTEKQEDQFIIETTYPDILSDLCTETNCNTQEIKKRQKEIMNLLNNKDKLQQPIILFSHFWDFEKLQKSKEGKEHLQFIINQINSKNYHKTTIIEYYNWREKLNQTNFTFKETKKEIFIKFIYAPKGLTFEIDSNKKVNCNCELICQNQICQVQKEIKDHIYTI